MQNHTRVKTSIWINPAFLALPPDAQRLYLYLRTCPHSNPTGCWRMPIAYMVSDLREPVDNSVDKSVDRLCKTGFIFYDKTSQFLWVPNLLDDDGIVNPNQAKYCTQFLDIIPGECHFGLQLVKALRGFQKHFPKGYLNRLANRFETVRGTVTETVRQTVSKRLGERLPKQPSPITTPVRETFPPKVPPSETVPETVSQTVPSTHPLPAGETQPDTRRKRPPKRPTTPPEPAETPKRARQEAEHAAAAEQLSPFASVAAPERRPRGRPPGKKPPAPSKVPDLGEAVLRDCTGFLTEGGMSEIDAAEFLAELRFDWPDYAILEACVQAKTSGAKDPPRFVRQYLETHDHEFEKTLTETQEGHVHG